MITYLHVQSDIASQSSVDMIYIDNKDKLARSSQLP